VTHSVRFMLREPLRNWPTPPDGIGPIILDFKLIGIQVPTSLMVSAAGYMLDAAWVYQPAMEVEA
jgi:hypothetical protein